MLNHSSRTMYYLQVLNNLTIGFVNYNKNTFLSTDVDLSCLYYFGCVSCALLEQMMDRIFHNKSSSFYVGKCSVGNNYFLLHVSV